MAEALTVTSTKPRGKMGECVCVREVSPGAPPLAEAGSRRGRGRRGAGLPRPPRPLLSPPARLGEEVGAEPGTILQAASVFPRAGKKEEDALPHGL